MPAAALGAERPGLLTVSGAEARLFERGIALKGPLGETPIHFNFPSLLRPTIWTGGSAGALFASAIRVSHPAGQLDQLKPIVTSACEGRLFLSPKGQGGPAGTLKLGDAAPLTGGGSSFQVELDGTLAHRQIYDVKIRTEDGLEQIVAHNAVYYRDDWSNFGLGHITDMHVARRIDKFRRLLREAGLNEAADRVVNWNDRFRGFVKYANYLHDAGKLDLLIATGDLYDYIHEDDDDPSGGGNAELLSQLILGLAPGPDFPDVEPLRVPIYAVPGNHDYRSHPYRLIFDLSITAFGYGLNDLERVKNYSGYRIRNEEAKELANRLEGGSGTGVPNLSDSDASRMVAIDQENLPYQNFLGARGSYVIELGPHKIAMLDTEWDAGVMGDLTDGVRYVLSQNIPGLSGLTSEDERSFIGGSPNSHGIQDAEYELATQALSQTPDGSLFIVGLHAPLFNPRAYPYFLRETQRPQQGDQTEAFLADETDATRDSIRSDHPSWFRPPNDHRDVKFVKRVDAADNLSYGVARDRGEDLIRSLAGIGSQRPADLVLAGHTHRHNEFVVRSNEGGELAFYMDFYTQNPGSYYPTRYMKSWKNGDAPSTDVTYVDVVPGSSGEYRPWSAPTGQSYQKVIQVPPYAEPLNDSQNPSEWWKRHRPLVLQTGALGPVEDKTVSFSGFRIIAVENNVISKIHFISSDRLQEANYQLPWDEAIKVETAGPLPFLGRSEQYGMPAAASAPSSFVLSTGIYDIIYRSEANDLLELWRDANSNESGAGNLTGVAQAPAATGSPIPYANTNINQIIVPYRATDGVVHSVYSIPGGTGHDNLGGTANSPKAEGNPIGYYNAGSDLHHVIYRSNNGHLQALYWQGNNVVAYEDLYWTNFPLAAGDPSAYYGGGANIIAYRGTDGEIHTIYWSGADAAQHDGLSAYASMPHAAGDPTAYHYAGPEGDVHQVTYRAVDGQLIELWWVGASPVQGWSLTSSAGAPPAASDPAAYFNPEANAKYVIYTSADGHIHELRWKPGAGAPTHSDLTAESGAPLANGRPSAFFASAARTRHVVFRGQDGHIHEIVRKYGRELPGGVVFGGGAAGGGVLANG